jgi:integrase
VAGLDYRPSGKQKSISLGVYPAVTLQQARKRADQARKLLDEGIDPSAERKQQAQEQAAQSSFENVARDWHSQQSGRWMPDHAARVLSRLEGEVFPAIGNQPIQAITPPAVLLIIRKIESRGAIDMASRVLQHIKAVFAFAIQTGKTLCNPASDLTGVLKQRKAVHRLAMSAADLPEFLAKLEGYQGDRQTRLALRLALLTFVRTSELLKAEWAEFETEGQAPVWRIPAERMKHWVPLSTQALAALQELRAITGAYRLLFPGQCNTEQPISNNTMLYALYRMGYHRRATVHGFRATASTLLNESGFRPDVIERQFAHVEQNKVRAAYHRAEYLEERRLMMQAWGDYLDGLKAGGVPTKLISGKP